MRILHNFVAIVNPLYKPEDKDKKTIILTDEDKKSVAEEKLKELTKLEIAMVGPECPDVKKGDKVFIAPIRVTQAPFVTIKGVSYILVRYQDVIVVY